MRIAQLVKKGEDVLVMFSGAGPYLFVLGRNSPAKRIVGAEINPWAHYYAEQSLVLNKMEKKINIILGDVIRKPKLHHIFLLIWG